MRIMSNVGCAQRTLRIGDDLGLNQNFNTTRFIVYAGSQSSPLQKLFLKSGGWRAELRDAAMVPPLQSAQ